MPENIKEFVRSEYVEQSHVAYWLMMHRPKVCFTCSLAGLSGRILGRAKKLGYQNGTPDLMIFEARVVRSAYSEELKDGSKLQMFPLWSHGLFLEMKITTEKTKKNGGVSDDQRQYHKELMDRGYTVAVCYGYDEAIKVLTEYLKY